MADRITYSDKVGVIPRETHINQVWDDDMNEIKTKVNANATLLETVESEVDVNTLDILDLQTFNTDIGYSVSDIAKAIRKALNPYEYVSYLPDATPYTTQTITSNSPAKITVPTTIKSSNYWNLLDLGGSNFVVKYTGATTETFKVFMSTSMTTSVNNVVVDFLMYKNGVAEPGVTIARKVSTGSDVGSLCLIGEFEASPNDYIESYLSVSSTTTVTLDKTSLIITEKN
jgi:hypothetical protein